MTIDFGNIKSYNPDRGFGFVGHTFFNPDGKVFFHIKKIKKKYPELARKWDSGEDFKKVNFWYEFETTEKGEQVSELWLSTADMPQSYAHELCNSIQKVESIWKNVDSPKPSLLDLATIDLAGVDRRHELSVERDNLQRAAEEERRREAEALRRQKEIERLAERYNLTKTEAEELHQLLTEMRLLNFTHSKQLSAYIVRHRLGYRYPNISGIVRMRAGTEWDFHGGFPTEIYKIICFKLNLRNNETDARPIKFTPFKDVYELD